MRGGDRQGWARARPIRTCCRLRHGAGCARELQAWPCTPPSRRHARHTRAHGSARQGGVVREGAGVGAGARLTLWRCPLGPDSSLRGGPGRGRVQRGRPVAVSGVAGALAAAAAAAGAAAAASSPTSYAHGGPFAELTEGDGDAERLRRGQRAAPISRGDLGHERRLLAGGEAAGRGLPGGAAWGRGKGGPGLRRGLGRLAARASARSGGGGGFCVGGGVPCGRQRLLCASESAPPFHRPPPRSQWRPQFGAHLLVA